MRRAPLALRFKDGGRHAGAAAAVSSRATRGGPQRVAARGVAAWFPNSAVVQDYGRARRENRIRPTRMVVEGIAE
jgi:hypothetical protein